MVNSSFRFAILQLVFSKSQYTFIPSQLCVWRQHSLPIPHLFLLPEEAAGADAGHGRPDQRRKSTET
ncbi:hypothetical protein AVEN_206372-1, partial [Araneus ventricosus]